MGQEKRRLENEKNCQKVNSDHAAAMAFYSSRNDRMEDCINTLRGKIFNDKELESFSETGRAPVSINKALAPFRTIIGVLSNSMFDVSFSPVGEEDQRLAEALSKLASWEEKRNDDFMQNTLVAQAALATGRGCRLCVVETPPGEKAYIKSVVLNPFAVYFDPESRDLTTRSDAQFVDVASWLSLDEILNLYPDAEGKIRGEDKDDRLLSGDYQEYDKSADRRHEIYDNGQQCNGKYKVIERYYKTTKSKHYAFDGQTGESYEVDLNEARFAGIPTIKRSEEWLWLAVWSPGLLEGDAFLSNEEYHAQPRDPDTKKIIFPVLELVSDNVMGESDGFITFIKDPQKIFSVLYTQLIDAAKHSSGSYVMNPLAFTTDEEASRAKRLKALSNQVYEVKSGMHNEALQPIPSNNVSFSTLESMRHLEPTFDELMSAPKALQGISENSSTPASLNAQRIEQSTAQLAGFFSNNKKFLTQTLKLRYAYWREKYTEQMTFRIFDPGNGRSEQVSLNGQVPAVGWDGRETGELEKINDLQSAEFDVAIVDSVRSPTYMRKQADIIGSLMQNGAVMSNPAIANVLMEWLIRMSDLPAGAKEQMKQQMQAQAQAQAMQQQQINQQQPEMAGMAV